MVYVGRLRQDRLLEIHVHVHEMENIVMLGTPSRVLGRSVVEIEVCYSARMAYASGVVSEKVCQEKGKLK